LVSSASFQIPSIWLSTNSRSFCIMLPESLGVWRSIRTLPGGVSYTLCALWHTSSRLLEPSNSPELRASLLTWNVPKRKFVLNFTTLMELIPSLIHFSDQVKNRYRLEGQKAAQSSLLRLRHTRSFRWRQDFSVNIVVRMWGDGVRNQCWIRGRNGSFILLKYPSSYRTENTLHLGYKNQSVNFVEGNNRCLFSDPHKTHNCNVWEECRFFLIQPGGTYLWAG